MQVKKAAEAVNSGAPTAVQLEAINAQSKAQLNCLTWDASPDKT